MKYNLIACNYSLFSFNTNWAINTHYFASAVSYIAFVIRQIIACLNVVFVTALVKYLVGKHCLLELLNYAENI